VKKILKNKLPWQKPKPEKEEPHAAELIDRILKSPTYRIAEDDSEFIHSYETRGIRLELDYLKAELSLSREGVEHTIVVFGSARIRERKTAVENLAKAQKRLEKEPDSPRLIEKLASAEKMVENSLYYDDARKLGRYIGRCGKGPDDSRIMLMTGGGPGIMEAANRGAYDVGAKSAGMNIQLPHEQFPNPYVTPGLCFQFRYFSIRKLHFFLRARALVVYPGGFGTFDELFEILTLVQTRKREAIPVVMVGKRYWSRVVDFDFMVEEGVVSKEELGIFKMVESADEAWDYILSWHEEYGTPLLHKNESSGRA
jgi:uncharacterized protein (TIGR00730 family)